MPLVLTAATGPGTTETWLTPRLSSVTGLVMMADQGVPGQSKVDLPDAPGTRVTHGLKRFYASDTDSPADNELIYDGYLTNRGFARNEEHLVGAQRLISVNLVDLNNLLSTYIIRGTKTAANGNRPAESDVARVLWWLGSAFNGQVNDFGLVSTGSPVMMDAADLRGQNGGNVLRDCGLASGKQWFLYYDETEPTSARIGLFYDFSRSAVFSSTLRLSNIPGDRDDVTTFDVESAEMDRDPSQILTGVIVDYDGGSVYVDSDDLGLTTKTDYYVRQMVAPARNIKTLATATAYGQRLLRAHSTEEDSAKVTVLLPSTHIGLIKAGHRIEQRYGHFEPEYRDWSWWRATKAVYNQTKSRQWWKLDLELEPIPPLAPAFCCLTWPSDQSTGTGQPMKWLNSGDDVHMGDPPYPNGTPTYGLLHKQGAGPHTGVVIDGTGTLDLVEAHCDTVLVGGARPVTVTWAIRLNGVVVASEQQTDTGTSFWDPEQIVSVTGLAVVPGDVVDLWVTDSTGQPFLTPGGAGTSSFHFLVTGNLG